MDPLVGHGVWGILGVDEHQISLEVILCYVGEDGFQIAAVVDVGSERGRYVLNWDVVVAVRGDSAFQEYLLLLGGLFCLSDSAFNELALVEVVGGGRFGQGH
jgi:hypothetical protein